MEKARRVVREYDISFKIDSVRLVVDEGYSVTKAAERLGISPRNLYHWKRQYLEGRLDPALKRAPPTAQEAELRRLREENRQLKLEAHLLNIDGVNLNAPGAPRSPKHLNVRVAGVDGEDLLMGLDAAGVYASAGSACAAGTLAPSHVLLAMGLSHREAKASIRLSLGRGVTDEMVDFTAQAFAEVVERCRVYVP